jgi:hypothetical protein
MNKPLLKRILVFAAFFAATSPVMVAYQNFFWFDWETEGSDAQYTNEIVVTGK